MSKENYLVGYRPLTTHGSPFTQTWNIIKWRNIAMVKMAELLHVQLMRKGRYREYSTMNHPNFGECYTVRWYDIKSSSRAPYSYDGSMGLNQFFVGQSPYKWYDGDPGSDSGIYHDTCEIVSSFDNATVTKYGYKDLDMISQWGGGEMVHTAHPILNPLKEQDYYYRFPYRARITCTFAWDQIFYKQKNFNYIYDSNGNKIIDVDNSTIKVHRQVIVDMERWVISADGKRTKLGDIKDKVFNTTLGATPLYTKTKNGRFEELVISGYNKDIDIFADLPAFYDEFKPKIYTHKECQKLIGKSVEFDLRLSGIDDFCDVYLWGKKSGRLIAFGSGNIVGYIDDGRVLIKRKDKRSMVLKEAGADSPEISIFIPYYQLALKETFDPITHMPLRGAYRFVTQWSSHYGLHVEEDKETWEKLVPIVVVIIVIVVTVVTLGTCTAQTAAAGSAVTAGTTATASAAATAGFYAGSASALAAIGITTAAGTMLLASLFLTALGAGLSYAGAKHGKMGLIKGGQIASFAGAAMGVASIGASINTALSSVTAEAVASSSGCYLSEAVLAGGSGAASGTTATGLMASGASITTNLGVTTVNSGMGVVSVSAANSSVLFINGVAVSGSGIVGSMAAQFGMSITTTTQLMSLANIATTTYSIGNNLYGGFNSVKDVLSLLRGEPVDLDIPQNESDEEAIAGGNGAIGVSPSVVMRFERDILPPDLGLDQDSLIYVRPLLKAYIHNKGNLANLVDNIIQTRLKKRYAPLIPSNV